MPPVEQSQVSRFPLLATWQAMFSLVFPPMGGELVAGDDGLLHSTSAHGNQFYPWSLIRGCSVSGSEVTTLHDDGCIVRWHLTGPADAARLARIAEEGIEGDERLLARGTPFEMRWPVDLHHAVRKLVDAGVPAPEDGLDLDERLDLIECPHAPVMSRACAALQVAGNAGARDRIRRAAMRTAHPGSRDLLLAIADLDLKRLSEQSDMWSEGAPKPEPEGFFYHPSLRCFVSSPAERAWTSLLRYAWLAFAALSITMLHGNPRLASTIAVLTPLVAVIGPVPWHVSQQRLARRLRGGEVLFGDAGVFLGGDLRIGRSQIGQGFVRTLGDWYFVRLERNPGRVLADIRCEDLEAARQVLSTLGLDAGQRPASFQAMHPVLARWYGALLPLFIAAAVVSFVGSIHAAIAPAAVALSLGLCLLARLILSHRTVTVHPDAVEFRWGPWSRRVPFCDLEKLERTANGGTLVTRDGTRLQLRGVPNDPPDRRPARGDDLVDRVRDALEEFRARGAI